MANSSHDLDTILSRFEPEKRARYQAYEKVVSAFGTPTQSLFVLDNDNEADTFRRDFDEYLKVTGKIEDTRKDSPYYVVRIGYDGDMLDDMFRLAVSSEAENFNPATLDASMLYSKQSIFQHLYNSITRDKFIIFHITEFPLAYYFETAVVVDVEELSDIMDPTVHDATIERYLNDLRQQGSEEHRKTYSFFYRISTSLLMELSNVFLVVPTAGMNRHMVVTSWRTQTLLLGFSPLTWSSGSFRVYDLSGRDIDARWAYPAPPAEYPSEKQYVSLVPLRK
ncbi:MAG: hypothetical protein BAJATHORv1_10312 [Candidatus Thorarchaeota archaeon]|nr:MAG: hypothetical protein BAJATHORv1_10312 [Candidatus Thorarchaeota archaeon]